MLVSTEWEWKQRRVEAPTSNFPVNQDVVLYNSIVPLYQDFVEFSTCDFLFVLQGRARALNAKFYMLVDQGLTDQVKSELTTFRGIEKV